MCQFWYSKQQKGVKHENGMLPRIVLRHRDLLGLIGFHWDAMVGLKPNLMKIENCPKEFLKSCQWNPNYPIWNLLARSNFFSGSDYEPIRIKILNFI